MYVFHEYPYKIHMISRDAFGFLLFHSKIVAPGDNLSLKTQLDKARYFDQRSFSNNHIKIMERNKGVLLNQHSVAYSLF